MRHGKPNLNAQSRVRAFSIIRVAVVHALYRLGSELDCRVRVGATVSRTIASPQWLDSGMRPNGEIVGAHRYRQEAILCYRWKRRTTARDPALK